MRAFIAHASFLSRQPRRSSRTMTGVVAAEREARASTTFCFRLSLPVFLKLTIHAEVSMSILSVIAHFLQIIEGKIKVFIISDKSLQFLDLFISEIIPERCNNGILFRFRSRLFHDLMNKIIFYIYCCAHSLPPNAYSFNNIIYHII